MTLDASTATGPTSVVGPVAGVASPGVPATGPLVGVDLGIGDELDCEADLRTLRSGLEQAGLGEGLWITTHPVGVRPDRHAAIVVALPAAGDGPAGERRAFDAVRAALASGHTHSHAVYEPAIVCGDQSVGEREALIGAYEALAAREAGFGGRAVAFPGDQQLIGEVTVADILASAVDDVVDLARGEVTPADRVGTRDFVRPLLRDGRWVLIVQPAVGETFVPFEEPNPHRCCQDH
ncbi:hypothetical protein [Kribbia dieselivorans]|uniref:hypothetical protein n=1 Tax=Kribbia dieselivorans TaxID=331526 RepID=UPI0008395C9A|nr:hypothetical protein [Kribbia dieselivorans]